MLRIQNEAKHQYLINKLENFDFKEMSDLKTFIKYSNDIQVVYKNIDQYNSSRKCNKLITFDDMIAHTLCNKKLNPIATELFVRGRKMNISLVFIVQFYFQTPKDVRLNIIHFFIMKIPNKRELQQITFNHSSDIEFKNFIFMKLIIDCSLSSDNPLDFRENLLERI